MAPAERWAVTFRTNCAQLRPEHAVTGVHCSDGTVAPYRAPSRAACVTESLRLSTTAAPKIPKSRKASNGKTSANSTRAAPRSPAPRRPGVGPARRAAPTGAVLVLKVLGCAEL